MIKQSIVAGTFYPKEKAALVKVLGDFFEKAKGTNHLHEHKRLFAIVVPHAGYVFSGQTAADIYSIAMKYDYKNAVIVTPSHYSNNIDFFVGKYDAYETPLGITYTNKEMVNKLLSKKGFYFDQMVDLREHSLDVHIPFLQYINPMLQILPIIFVKQNISNAKLLSGILKEFLNNETLLIISTDLSHFHKSTVAEEKDKLLIENIRNFDLEALLENLAQNKIEACGIGGIMTLLHLLKSYESVEIGNIKYTHSGYTSKDFKQVVGYFSCGFYI